MNMQNLFRVIYYTVMASAIFGVLTTAYAQSTGTYNSISSTFCGIVSTVQSIIAFVALLMFIGGGVLYAIAHFLPAAGQIKGSMQGWAMGMIIGGIIGIILVIIAQPIVNMVVGFGGNSISSVSCS